MLSYLHNKYKCDIPESIEKLESDIAGTLAYKIAIQRQTCFDYHLSQGYPFIAK